MKSIFKGAISISPKVIGVMLFGSVAFASGNAADWRIGVVDAGVGGQYSSLRLDAEGNAHVAYLDESNIALKYAFWDHRLNKWFTTTIDRSIGFCSLAVDSNQHPHISYLDYGYGKLKYAHWSGNAWETQVLEIQAKLINFYTSIALGANDNPSITFYEYEGPEGEQEIHLRNVSWDGNRWGVRTVDPTQGSGKFSSIAADGSGNFRIAYSNVKYEDASLRYATFDGRFWNVEILEGEGRPGTGTFSTALVIDKAGQSHITYSDPNNRLVKYATKVNGKWTLEVVDSIKGVGYPDRNGIALDEAGVPYISYYDSGAGVLKLAHRVAKGWVTEVVDGNFAGYTSSLQIYHGTIWITYADQSQKDLKFARRSIEPLPPISQQASKEIAKDPLKR